MMDSYIVNFLKKNGFEKMEEDSYANANCNVVLDETGCFAVADNEGNTIYSKDDNIYWLIGVLTYFDYIPKYYLK